MIQNQTIVNSCMLNFVWGNSKCSAYTGPHFA